MKKTLLAGLLTGLIAVFGIQGASAHPQVQIIFGEPEHYPYESFHHHYQVINRHHGFDNHHYSRWSAHRGEHDSHYYHNPAHSYAYHHDHH